MRVLQRWRSVLRKLVLTSYKRNPPAKLNDYLQEIRGIFTVRTSETKMPSRRVLLAAFLTACSRAKSEVRLHARPAPVDGGGPKPGVNALKLRAQRDALFYVPASAPDPAPLVVYLHGATGDEQQGIRRLSALA